MSPTIALTLIACGPSSISTGDLSTGADTAADTVADTASDTGSGSAPEDSAGASTEEIPGASLSGICQIQLECGQEIPDEPKIPCALEVVEPDGAVTWSGPAGVERRGRSSSSFPKPQYSVELWDEAGAAVDVDLMGLGSESDWIFNGAHVDRALFRNPLGFDLFREMGADLDEPGDRYAPEVAFCELTLDGEPRGLYHLTERVKRDASRVALEPDESGETFLLKLDDEDGIWPNSAGYGTWQLVYPNADDVSPGATAVIQSWMAGWEGATLGADPGDPDAGVFQWLDLESAVDLVILEELMRNNDAYYLSLYLWRRPGEPMRLVPWDLDLTLGQPSYNDNENPEGWILYRPSVVAAWGESQVFKARLVERWAELRGGILSDAALDARIEAYLETMGASAYRNFEIWPISEIEFGWSGVDYLYEVESYDEELARVRGWIPQRTAWIDANISGW